MLEYELFRRNSRPELPPLVSASSSGALGRLHAVLEQPRYGDASLSLQAVEFDVIRIPPELGASLQWTAFVQRAQATARAAGFGELVAAGLAGALRELADNIIQHSEMPESGIAAFARARGRFEYVVADTGIGMLASLRQAPELRSLRDDLEALPLAVKAGVSRYGRAGGRGYGFRAVFLPLAAASGLVRLRSGAAVLEMSGRGLQPDRGVCSQRPVHKGVTVSSAISPT